MTVFRDNREPAPTQDLSPMAPEATQPPVAPFSDSNEAQLAASVKEVRDKSEEYARLTSEEARQQWEGLTRRNLLREQQQAEAIADATAVGHMNRRVKDELDAEALLQQHAEIGASLPENWTENTLPLEKLRAVASITQKLENVRERLGVNADQAQQQPKQHPETFPDGSLYQFTNLEDGQIELKLITGERFIGDPMTVTQEIAKSKVHTTRWAREKVAQAQQQPQTPAEQPAPQPPEGIQEQWTPEVEAQAQAFLREQQAQSLGFSNSTEMFAWGNQVNAFIEQSKNERLVTEFMARHPEYPNTDQANDALTGMIGRMGWEYNLDTMEACHAYALQNGIYQPLSKEQQRASAGFEQQQSRPSPPPMISGRAPDSYQQHDNNLYRIPLADLRKQAIAQELGQ